MTVDYRTHCAKCEKPFEASPWVAFCDNCWNSSASLFLNSQKWWEERRARWIEGKLLPPPPWKVQNVEEYDGAQDEHCPACGRETGEREPYACMACFNCSDRPGAVYGIEDSRKLIRAWGVATGRYKPYESVARIKPAEPEWGVEPWVCPVCLSGKWPKAKDCSICVRCRPMEPPNGMTGGTAEDVVKTNLLAFDEGRARGEAKVRHAMALHRNYPVCCNKPCAYRGWEHVHGNVVEVLIECRVCGEKDRQRLEVRR